MNFVDLVNAVITETNRPDMGFVAAYPAVGIVGGGDGRIPLAVQAATLAAHSREFYFKDILTAQIVFDTPAYIQEVDTTQLPRYRAPSYVRKNDPTLQAYQLNPSILPPLFNSVGAVNIQQSMKLLRIIDVKNILDNYHSERLDVAYQAGDTFFIKSSSLLSYILAGWYAYPNIDMTAIAGIPAANFSSFIARDHPFAIVYAAASKIFQGIGQNEASRKYDSPVDPKTGMGGLVQTEYHNVDISNIVAEGS